MVGRIALSGAILVMAFLMVGVLPVQAGGKKSDSEVKVSATATKPDAAGKQINIHSFLRFYSRSGFAFCACKKAPPPDEVCVYEPLPLKRSIGTIR